MYTSETGEFVFSDLKAGAVYRPPAAESRVAWAEENTSYFTPDAARKLEIDEDLRQLQVGFDAPKFFGVVA